MTLEKVFGAAGLCGAARVVDTSPVKASTDGSQCILNVLKILKYRGGETEWELNKHSGPSGSDQTYICTLTPPMTYLQSSFTEVKAQ